MSQYLIAVATTDGHTVDQHFGSAKQIVIYRADESAYTVEKALSFEGGECTGEHDKALARLEAVEDCKYIIAAKVGSKIQRYFEFNRQKYFEMAGFDIDHVLTKIIKYQANKER